MMVWAQISQTAVMLHFPYVAKRFWLFLEVCFSWFGFTVIFTLSKVKITAYWHSLQRIKDDELSSRIQRMLGNYEDGPEEPAQSGHTDRSRAISGPAAGESWDSFPALAPPVEPLSPLRSSDSDTRPSPERHRPDTPPLTLELPLTSHRKLANSKKPTAYVRPMDGPDQVTSDSPELKDSLESDEQLQDLKESSTPNLTPLQAADVSVTARARLKPVCYHPSVNQGCVSLSFSQIVSGARVEDILQVSRVWDDLVWLESCRVSVSLSHTGNDLMASAADHHLLADHSRAAQDLH